MANANTKLKTEVTAAAAAAAAQLKAETDQAITALNLIKLETATTARPDVWAADSDNLKNMNKLYSTAILMMTNNKVEEGKEPIFKATITQYIIFYGVYIQYLIGKAAEDQSTVAALKQQLEAQKNTDGAKMTGLTEVIKQLLQAARESTTKPAGVVTPK